MIDALNGYFLIASNFVWSYVIVGLCVVVGVYASFRLMFIQFRSFPHAIALLRGKYEDKDEADGITTFQALATALSGTTGIGNIAGVAVAIKLGGPGAIFWMWVMALIGMALKYMEGTLGSLYRGEIGGRHEMGGGPMYYITRGLGERWRPVATFYAVCTAVACLGAWNMFQSNQAAATLQDQLQVPTWLTGAVLSFFVALVLIGGIKRIGLVASRIVPTMCVIYVSTVMVICLMNYDLLPAVMNLIFEEAFRFDSAGGGILGTAILIGIRRAVFSNEAGTGTAAIAHAAAHTRHPVRQGIVASLGPFIDTIVVCAATAFVILLSGYYGTESYQNQSGEVISFETADVHGTRGPLARGSWRITSSNIPPDTGSLQRFTEGNLVLAYKVEARSRTMLSPVIALSELFAAVPESSHKIAGIRFSGWSNTEQVDVTLRNSDTGETLIQPLFAHPADESRPALEGRTPTGSWGSWVIKPANETARSLLSGDTGSLELQFSVQGEGRVFIDRVEVVSEANGIVLSTAAFARFFGAFAGIFIPIAALFFAYTTVLAGNYFGEVACHFLNEKLVKPYLWIYICATFIGCVVNLNVVINFSDLTLGIMTIPNLIAMAVLSPVVARQTRLYFSRLKSGEIAAEDDEPGAHS